MCPFALMLRIYFGTGSFLIYKHTDMICQVTSVLCHVTNSSCHVINANYHVTTVICCLMDKEQQKADVSSMHQPKLGRYKRNVLFLLQHIFLSMTEVIEQIKRPLLRYGYTHTFTYTKWQLHVCSTADFTEDMPFT